MSELQRANILVRAIDALKADVAAIQAALAAAHPHHAEMVGLRDRYSTSGDPNRVPRFETNLEKIRRHFTGEDIGRWEWDVSGVDWGLLRDKQVKQFCSFGWTDYNNEVIRIARKAFLMHPLILKGIMLHEVTHAQFTTQDIAYDLGVFPTSSHDRLAGLPDADKINNADNWRLFYQDAKLLIG